MLNGERQTQLDGFKSRPLHGAEPRTIRHLHATECGAIRAAEGHAHPPLKVSKPYTRRRALHEQLTFAEVRLAQPGSISYLEICPQRPLLMMKPLIQHEAILAVEVAGLNFRDVLNVLGMDPTGKVRPIGGESTGLVSVSGPLSVHVQPSNPVYGLVPGSLRAFAQCDAQYICQMPHVLQFDQAVTLPVVWVTARYCVAEAQLRSGQSVLVHAASGGVGLLSVQCGRHIRAAVQATGGAIIKHRLLHSHGVSPSSSRAAPACAAHLPTLLHGCRLHSVINALSNDYISLSFALLTKGGAFVEIGKNGIWSQAHASTVRQSVDYVATAVDEGCRNCTGWNADPWWFNQQLQLLNKAALVQKVTPLPQQGFAIEAVQGALRLLQRGGNLGKVVVRVGGSSVAHGVIFETELTESIHQQAPQRSRDCGTLVRLWLDDRVALLELYDPQRFNTLSWALGDDMHRAVNHLRHRCDSVRAVVLHGAGSVFCAGGNPYASGAPMPLAASTRLLLHTVLGVVSIRRTQMPVACAVHGAMVGGAAAIFLQTDVRASEASATFQHGKSLALSP